jgi:hypothetical protein
MNARATNAPFQRLPMTIATNSRDSRFAAPDMSAYSYFYTNHSDPAQSLGDSWREDAISDVIKL